jgi:hypothetical protein
MIVAMMKRRATPEFSGGVVRDDEKRKDSAEVKPPKEISDVIFPPTRGNQQNVGGDGYDDIVQFQVQCMPQSTSR